MLSGHLKAAALLKTLGETGEVVLPHVKSEFAATLRALIAGDIPASDEEIREILSEAIHRIQIIKEVRAHLPPEPKPEPEPEPEEVEDDFEVFDELPTEPEDEVGRIVSVLSTQKPQVVAFVLEKMNEEMKKEVWDSLPGGLKSKVEKRSVEMIPISDKVYTNIYNTLFPS